MLEKVSTGIPGLDDVLEGGYPANSMLLVQGEPGSGKSTVGLQFMVAGAARGDKALFVSLSQTHEELQAIADGHGLDISALSIVTMDSLGSTAERSYSIDTNELMLSELMRALYDTLDSHDPDLLVFDSLLELRLLSPDPIAYRTELLNLRHHLAQRRITTLLIDHIETPDTERHVEGIAHGALTLTSEAPPIGITHRRLRVTKIRGAAFREGYHDFRIHTGGVEVYPRIVPASSEGAGLSERMATGQEPLDRMLGGGLEFGTTTLVAGQAGVGKSTLSTVFSVAAAEAGYKSALYLFEERPEIFRERSDSVGLDMTAHEKSGSLVAHHFDPAEISPGEFCQSVVEAVERDGIRLVVIDSLSGYLNALPYRQNVITHLHTLLQYLSRRGVLVVVTMAQHGLLGEEPRSDLDTSYLADAIILLRHYAAGSEIRRSIAVLKKRQSDHERRIQEFVIRPGAVEIKELSSEIAARQEATNLHGGR